MILKKVVASGAVVLASLSCLYPSLSFAASEDECAIWLCLPAGFPSGCGAAKSAMKKRIRHMKPPLPRFSSCIVKSSSNGSQMDSSHGFAAYIPPRKYCSRWQHYGRDNERCLQYSVSPEKYLKHRRCRVGHDGERTPQHCTTTFRFAEISIDGKKTGQTYYWR